MSKELEALEDIILYLNASEPKGLYCENIEIIQQALLKVEKEHKALWVIKEKNVWVARLKALFKKFNNDLDVLRIYNTNMSSIDKELTEEEFSLLKEVLK